MGGNSITEKGMGKEKDDTKESYIYDSAQAAATVCRQAKECGDELAKSLVKCVPLTPIPSSSTHSPWPDSHAQIF